LTIFILIGVNILAVYSLRDEIGFRVNRFADGLTSILKNPDIDETALSLSQLLADMKTTLDTFNSMNDKTFFQIDDVGRLIKLYQNQNSMKSRDTIIKSAEDLPFDIQNPVSFKIWSRFTNNAVLSLSEIRTTEFFKDTEDTICYNWDIRVR
jgi:hypothetical protein